MSTTVLRTIPCAGCSRRVGAEATICPYCGRAPRRKQRKAADAKPTVARAVGFCSRCGGRLRHHRSVFARILAGVGVRIRTKGAYRLACSSCGHKERAR